MKTAISTQRFQRWTDLMSVSKVGRNLMHFLKSENPETFIEGSNISGASQDSSKGKQMRTQWTVIVRADIVTVFYHRR